MDNYKKALSYAYKLDSGNYRDLVHSAYLTHYERYHENLFDRPEPYVIKAVRLRRDHEYRRLQGERSGVRFIRNQVYHEENFYDDCNSPDLLFEKTEAYENLLQQIDVFETREQMLQILTYKVAGYKQCEIAKMMGCTGSYISWQMKRLKSLIL